MLDEIRYKGGKGPISSSESALKATYGNSIGNLEGQKIFPPAAGFRPYRNVRPGTTTSYNSPWMKEGERRGKERRERKKGWKEE